MKKTVSKTIPWIAFLLLCIVVPCQGASTARLTVLHVNDVHGHILPYVEKSVDPDTPMSGGARLARMIHDEMDKNPDGCLLLAAGDMFQGTPISNVFRGQPVMEIMNYLKFDAMTFGNHEFDWGMKVLGDLKTSANFPFLSANIRDKSDQPVLGVKPYVVVKRGNLDIAIIGVTTTETPYMTKPVNVADLRFSEPETVLPGIIAEARKNGAKLVVVLSHLGMLADTELAQHVSGIDVIVGGHSHTVAKDPLLVGGTIIVQAGYYGLYLGVLELKVDTETGRVVAYTAKQELKAVTAGVQEATDKAVEKIVEGYHEKIKVEFAKVVGETGMDLTRNPSEESIMGDVVADSMREAAGTAVALENGGGLRADIPKGKITLEHVYTLLPFDNDIVSMDLSGAQLMEVLEKNADVEKRIMQVSGLKVEYNLALPKGSRVVKASIGGQAINPLQIYRVAVNDFLAAGGDQFETFTKGKNPVFGDNMKDAFVKYLGKHSPLNVKTEDRITFIK